eukprot:CAMPEP_0173429510 /NCGR_PEP_ID=MMETSP1357-20121228/8197_1 /TAXON_ID=77926 /ORGANISM="Hemiselmis rufescens, Strain PCC563" /LENGTH=341 /DNA_ID=CAMNT_0014393703 /DNA_START=74 /DNA_END=1099 /DNA_ORIENTATION=-
MGSHDKDFVARMRVIAQKVTLLWQEKGAPMMYRLSTMKQQSYGVLVGITTLLLWYGFSHDFLYFISLLAEILRCFGFFLLVLRVVKKTHSVQGLSLKSQQLFCGVFATRLMFKVFYEDDYLYAFVELLATCLSCYLVFLMRVQHRNSYQRDADTMKELYIIAPCLLVALFLHPSVTKTWLMNVLWAFSTYLECFALLPQLFVFHSASRTVDNMTSLWIVSLFLSRALECTFWIIALFFRDYQRTWSKVVWYVVITELVHTAMLLDFVRNFYKCYKQVTPHTRARTHARRGQACTHAAAFCGRHGSFCGNLDPERATLNPQNAAQHVIAIHCVCSGIVLSTD